MRQNTFIIAAFLIATVTAIFYFSTHYTVLKYLFPEKIWVHRVNSMVKLREVSDRFKGVELDIEWKNHQMEVNHPPAKSINLNLSDYFASTDKTEYKFWLDFKNLSNENYKEALSSLDSITRILNFKRSNIIIESGSPQYLKLFEKRGYLTSFYLPSGFSSSKEKDRDNLKHFINDQTKKYPTTFLSTFLGEYVYLKIAYPEKDKILWHTGGFKSIKNKIRIYKALLDKNVKVILLPVKSDLGDR